MAKRNDTSGERLPKRKSAPTPQDLLNDMAYHLNHLVAVAQQIEALVFTRPEQVIALAFEITERASILHARVRSLKRRWRVVRQGNKHRHL